MRLGVWLSNPCNTTFVIATACEAAFALHHHVVKTLNNNASTMARLK
jgi:hypothetical protein